MNKNIQHHNERVLLSELVRRAGGKVTFKKSELNTHQIAVLKVMETADEVVVTVTDGPSVLGILRHVLDLN